MATSNLAHFYTEYQIELNSSAWFMLQTKQQKQQIAIEYKENISHYYEQFFQYV